MESKAKRLGKPLFRLCTCWIHQQTHLWIQQQTPLCLQASVIEEPRPQEPVTLLDTTSRPQRHRQPADRYGDSI
ncbi:hypothetical protein MRX96_009903 [Rhipicephalus microplus]